MRPAKATAILDPGSAYTVHARGGEAPSSVIVVCRSRIQDQVAVAVAVAGLTKRFFNHIQKDFLINVWGYPNYAYRGTLITRTERDPNYPYQWYDY